MRCGKKNVHPGGMAVIYCSQLKGNFGGREVPGEGLETNIVRRRQR